MVNSTLRYSVVALILFVCSGAAFAQSANDLWTDVEANSVSRQGVANIEATEYRAAHLDIRTLKETLQSAPAERSASAGVSIPLPMPTGEMMTFEVFESSVMHPDLASRFPEIRTYVATVEDNPGVYARLDVTPKGFHAMIMRAGESTVFIDPMSQSELDIEHYMSYERKHFVTQKTFDCGVSTTDESPVDFVAPSLRTPFADCFRKEYRIAITATGEYTQYHGGTVAGALAAQVTTMNRVNGVYERDLAIRMIIIANNDQLIYLDAATDPFNGSNAGTMINNNQTVTDQVIGSANYDIGHIFSTGGSGLAQLNAVCGTGKARGVTGISNPVGDPFDIDYVSHEIGHQFGGTHTQNNSCNRTGSTAVEPGSASTIMGYAGICAPNVQNNSDDHFHGANLFQMGNFIDGAGSTCAQSVDIGNTHPTVNSFSTGVTIPRSTPFALTAQVTDAEGDIMTYCWEQMDVEVVTMPPSPTATGGPAFRSNSPITSPTRYFPALSDVVAGNSPTWEVLSDVSRTYDFRLSVRDNNVGGSCTEYVDADISVDGNSGPFVTVAPSDAGISWNVGSAQTVVWSVAGTDVAPVSCANVNIKLSIDGGLTYPFDLVTTTANDGSENIIVPNVSTTTARVMIEAADNVFYDISDNDFTIVNQLESPCVNGLAGTYPCSGYDLVGTSDMTDLGFPNGVEANDIWGWTDPLDGKEYAVLGLTNGTSFIDISTPDAPIVLGHLPTHTTNSIWRDVKVYQNHAFIVSEAPGHGMQVFDLTRLRTVVSPPVTFTNDAHYSGFGSAHNIVINEATGFAYAVGATTFAGGLDFINIQNPTSPTDAGGFSDDGYTHDAQVVNYTGPDADYAGSEIAFASNENSLTIIDVSDKTDPQQLSRTDYPGRRYAHQGWLTEDQRYFLLDDELDEQQANHNTRTYIWDLLDLDNPVFLGFHESPLAAIDHNLYVKGDKVYQTNYRAGLRVFDLSDIANGNLVETGYFDVYPADDAALFNGAWSNYPYFESGNIIVSSIEEGLFVIAPIPQGPCSTPVALNAADITDIGATLSWSDPGGAESYDIEVVLAGQAPTGIPTVAGLTVTTFSFSGAASTAYEFYVTANCADDAQSGVAGPFAFSLANEPIQEPVGVDCSASESAQILFAEDFENGAIGWTGDRSSVDSPGDWEIPGVSISDGTGPSAAFEGSAFMMYEATGPSFDLAVITSPAIDLSQAVGDVELSFYMHAFGAGMGDLVVSVATDAAGPFIGVFGYSGQLQTSSTAPWQAVGVDLSAYAGQTVFLRFAHQGIGDFTGDMSIDAVSIEACVGADFCQPPTDLLAVGNLGSIDIAWQASPSSGSYDLEVVVDGDPVQGVPTVTDVNGTTYNFAPVTSGETYNIFVRTECGPGDNSPWVGPVTVTAPIDFCSGQEFTDTGGETGEYSNDEVDTTTICPSSAGDVVNLTFTSFNVESNGPVCYDGLTLYDSNVVGENVILPEDYGFGGGAVDDQWCWDRNLATPGGSGDLQGLTISSTHTSGCITAVFVSDFTVTRPGWEASVSCGAPSSCPAPLGIQFSGVTAFQANIDWSDDDGAESWDISVVNSGDPLPAQPTATGLTTPSYVYSNAEEQTSYDVYVRANCDAGEVSIWSGPFTFLTLEDFCDGVFTDSGAELGAYGNNESETTVICPSGGGDLEVTFTSFQVEINGATACYDALFIFDGSSTSAPAITPTTLGIGTGNGGFCFESGAGTGDLLGQTITPSDPDGCLTFFFDSDNTVTRQGWTADVVCGSVVDCPTDIDQDGTTDINDFILFNSAFGQTCTGCREDIDGSGVVDVSDFVLFNSAFGSDCAPRVGGDGLGLAHDLETALSDEFDGIGLNESLRKIMESMIDATSLSVYPNPTTGESLQVIWTDMNEEMVTFVITDLTGKEVYREMAFDAAGRLTLELTFDAKLSSGTYIISAASTAATTSRRFVVE